MENEPACRGECLFGKCPHTHCIKHRKSSQTSAVVRTDMQILSEGILPKIKPNGSGIGVAVDIGTTTVVVYLYELQTAKCLSVKTAVNAQTAWGVDVISRIQFCRDDENGLTTLHRAMIDELNKLMQDALKENGLETGAVTKCVFTGNTTMLHLLANLSPASMGELPFEPLSKFGYSVSGKELGLWIETAECYLTPCMSAFVGGDITSALLATGFDANPELCLLLDIGTNGEAAVGNKDFILCTSTAAGPAFEGAHIACGSASVPGAVNAVDVRQGKIITQVIGGGEPNGLCGSGLLDAIALLLRIALIDETGRIPTESENSRIRTIDGEAAVTLTDRIYITQKDVRELQTAKAAIAGGGLTLLKEAGKEAEEIKTVYLAGGFGNYMNQQSAREIGLLLSEFKDVRSVGNAAGAGAVITLFDDAAKSKLQHLCDISTHVELGGNPYFMEKYVDCMLFE